MDQNIKDIGLKINRMAWENKNEMTEILIKACIKTELSMEKESFSGRMDLIIKVNSKIIAQTDLDYTIGMMADNIKDNGFQIK